MQNCFYLTKSLQGQLISGDNMQQFIKYFESSSSICLDFGKTTSGSQFDEQTQAIEAFALTSINMCAQHSMSISTLLRENFLTDCFIISRNIIEVFFNLNWVRQGKTREEVLERVFQLEANPYNNFDKEIKLMRKNIDSDKPNLSKSSILEHVKLINGEKKRFPFLLVDKNNFNSDFKSVPSFAERMGDLRLKYYHLYRFTSMFTHPSPKLKEFFMRRVINDSKPTDSIVEPLKQILAYCLLFIKMSLEITKHILSDFNPENNLERQELYNKLVAIVLQSSEGYLTISTGTNT
jgi:hypothetical protein